MRHRPQLPQRPLLRPQHRTFISPDPIIDPNQPATLNAYAYGHGNPITNADPSGAWVPLNAQGRDRGFHHKWKPATNRRNISHAKTAWQRQIRHAHGRRGESYAVANQRYQAAINLRRMAYHNPRPGFWRTLAAAGSPGALILGGLRAANGDPGFWGFLAAAGTIENVRRIAAFAGLPPIELMGGNQYHYTFDLDGSITSVSSAKDVARFLIGNCSAVFTLEGCDNDFQVGDELNLQIDVSVFGADLYTQSAPVRVAARTDYGFSFEALEGHPEGEGRQIRFVFVDTAEGPELDVRAGGPGGAAVNWPGVRQVNSTLVARSTWQRLANNVAGKL